MFKKLCEGIGSVASASIIGAIAVMIWTGKAPWEVAKDISDKIHSAAEKSKSNEKTLDGSEGQNNG